MYNYEIENKMRMIFCNPRTVVRRTKRHQFVDPDYAYEPEEAEAVRQHRNSYGTKLKESLENRRVSKRDRRLQKFENGLDLGMVPGSGANGHRLTQNDVHPDAPREIWKIESFLPLIVTLPKFFYSRKWRIV